MARVGVEVERSLLKANDTNYAPGLFEHPLAVALVLPPMVVSEAQLAHACTSGRELTHVAQIASDRLMRMRRRCDMCALPPASDEALSDPPGHGLGPSPAALGVGDVVEIVWGNLAFGYLGDFDHDARLRNAVSADVFVNRDRVDAELLSQFVLTHPALVEICL